jgi:FtsH-binding integral membrane protein
MEHLMTRIGRAAPFVLVAVIIGSFTLPHGHLRLAFSGAGVLVSLIVLVFAIRNLRHGLRERSCHAR